MLKNFALMAGILSINQTDNAIGSQFYNLTIGMTMACWNPLSKKRANKLLKILYRHLWLSHYNKLKIIVVEIVPREFEKAIYTAVENYRPI